MGGKLRGRAGRRSRKVRLNASRFPSPHLQRPRRFGLDSRRYDNRPEWRLEGVEKVHSEGAASSAPRMKKRLRRSAALRKKCVNPSRTRAP